MLNKRYLVAIFLTISFLLLAGTVFHWIYKERSHQIRIERIRTAWSIASRISANAGATGDFAVISPWLTDTFQRDKELLLLGVADPEGKVLYLQSRLSQERLVPLFRLVLAAERRQTGSGDVLLHDNRSRPDSFHYSVSLDREKGGSLLLFYSPDTFSRERSLNTRRFYTAAVVIILSAGLALLLLGQLRKETGGMEESGEEEEEFTEERQLDYLKKRNMLLESEVENLAAFRENSLLTASIGTAAELVERTLDGLEEIHGPLAVRLHIGGGHLPHSLLHSLPAVHPVTDIRLAAMLAALPDLDLRQSNKAAFPLIVGEKAYGLLVMRRLPETPPFLDDNLHRSAQLLRQTAVALYNFFLYETAVTDALTGLYNRRHFDTRLREETERSIRYGNSLSLVLVDIDHFKECNDRHGHQTGDRVLQEIAALIRRNIRRTDFAFRYGGEEIAILMPETDLEDAADAMETLRTRIADHPFRNMQGETIRLSCSFGVTASEDGGDIEPGSLIAQADKALYASKRHGRNMVSRSLLPAPQDPKSAST